MSCGSLATLKNGYVVLDRCMVFLVQGRCFPGFPRTGFSCSWLRGCTSFNLVFNTDDCCRITVQGRFGPIRLHNLGFNPIRDCVDVKNSFASAKCTFKDNMAGGV